MRPNTKLFSCLALVALMGAAPSGSSITRCVPPSGDCTLSLGALNMRIDPRIGGRVISLSWKGKEFLTRQTIEPIYYGATCWPDPQSDWWPIDPALDVNAYTVLENSRYRIALKSAAGGKGLQMEKLFILHPADTSVEIIYTLRNSSDHPLRAGPWELIRSKGGLSFFPDGLHHALPASDLTGVTERDSIQWYLFDGKKKERGQKLYSGGSEGWLAHATDSLLFIKSYQQVTPEQIAPGQGEVELYSNPGATYVELETHGPYSELQPGSSVRYRVVWYLRDLPKGIERVPGNARLANYVRRFVHAHKQ